MPGWLNDNLGKRLVIIRDYVRNLWSSHTEPLWYTLHNESHCERVEESLHKLIPDHNSNLLSEEERFYLLSAAWLHDVGMILNLFGRNEDSNHEGGDVKEGTLVLTVKEGKGGDVGSYGA